jgi:hypothetical protein
MIDTRWLLVAYVLVSIVLWVAAAHLYRQRAGVSRISRLHEGWAASVLRFIYYVGIPYAALILGVVPGRYLGLVGLDRLQDRPASLLAGSQPASNAWELLSRMRDDVALMVLDWLPGVGRLAGLGAVMLLLLSATWLTYSHMRRRLISERGSHQVRRTWEPLPLRSPGPPGGAQWLRSEAGAGRGASQSAAHRTLGIGVLYQAVHWSFYRSAIWVLTDDLYLSVLGGIVLVLVEWMLEPGWTERAQRAQSKEHRLIDASILVATSVMFFFVPNLWLLLPLHGLLATASRRMAGLARPHPAIHRA